MDSGGKEGGKVGCGEAGSGRPIMITLEEVEHSHGGAKIGPIWFVSIGRESELLVHE